MTGDRSKHSHTVHCSSRFRDEVLALAHRRNVNAADLARSVLLLLTPEMIVVVPDPGEPPAGDRETVILRSGPSQGRPWRRKPRLQVRLPSGTDAKTARRALAVALALDRGEVKLELRRAGETSAAEIKEEVARLVRIVSDISSPLLAQGVKTSVEALHVLGFPPDSDPDVAEIRSRFRTLAAIHHPDSGTGSHQRMAQLNQAVEILRRRDH
ncbi:MAG: J domain-containing protein [Rhodospirillales bacterium]|nr:J domain-containing protein [Rhodospirillales bacterium]MSP80117.1 J domain-containing protein [Rhodospirillales bacterium]